MQPNSTFQSLLSPFHHGSSEHRITDDKDGRLSVCNARPYLVQQKSMMFLKVKMFTFKMRKQITLHLEINSDDVGGGIWFIRVRGKD